MDISSVTKAFQSERLIYRSPEDNDKDKEFFFKHIENDPVAKALADPSILRPKNKKGVEDFLTEFQKSVLAVVLCLSPEEAKNHNIESSEPVPIGFICIGWGGNPKNREQHRNTHIGIVIADAFRNKGYGGESINWALDWAFRCALCGIYIPSIDDHEEVEQIWYRKIFAVQREEGQSQVSLRPIGYVEDGSLELEPHPVIPPTKGFIVHQSCWPIFRDQMFLKSGRRYETEELLKVLFDFIRRNEEMRILVSRVYLDKRDYICGFRARKPDGTENFRIGLIQPDAETHFSLRSSDQVVAVHVATTFGGIVGLAFRIKDELGGVSWKLVGKVDKPDVHVGIKMLKPKNGPYISGLLLGLDACKVVSIQLVEKLGDFATIETSTPSRQLVWHPAAPQPDVATVLPPTIDAASPQPSFILNMDFGGPSGSLLPLLNRIVVFLDSSVTFSIRGLGFYYTDGKEREFGFREILHDSRERSLAIEQSLSINGPAGERITGVGFLTVLIHREHTVVFPYSLTISTNFGRCLKTTNKGRPLEYTEDDSSETHNLISPHGETITGFLAPLYMSPSLCAVEFLGLAHLNSRDLLQLDSPPITFDYEKEEARSRIDPYSDWPIERAPSSTVRLNGVKRVGISNGRAGRSRLPHHVAGFCFEFWDGRSPVYVGQWFHEIDHLDLDEGDRITSLTLWEEVEIDDDDGSTPHFGNKKFTGVRIEKSGAEPNAVEVHPGSHGDMIEACYAENHFERLDGFIWSLYLESDRVDVVTKPAKLAKGDLSRESIEHEAVFADSNKLFWRIQDKEGSWTSVSQMTAFFNPRYKRLCGMEFIYRDGQLKRAGYTEGAKATLTLDQGEGVTGATWRPRREHGGDELSVSLL
ncbi:hypothetical protein LZL87_010690 [Fusarium oxysporum]|nr:hypothetical protein LZL87_010690 [Fusarium oxysporum]